MNWIVIGVVVIVLVAYGAWYLSTQDQRAITKHDKPDQKEFPIIVDYNTQSFDQMVAAGNYQFVDPTITATNFPITLGRGKNEVTLTVLTFNQELSAEKIMQELDARGLAPARIEHVLALGVQHPGLELFNGPPIYFLGSTWQHPDGDLRVTRLATAGPNRLEIFWNKDPFLTDDWFAAVPKE